jgi:predicted DsbA family dithiol-disulfide isomerase
VTHFPLRPGLPREGVLLSQLFGGRNLDAAHARLYAMLDAEGLPYTKNRDRLYDTRLAHELSKWAAGKGTVGATLDDAIFRAYFVDARNVGDPDVLLPLATGVGLPEAEAREVLEKRTFQAAVDADRARSIKLGVTGVPTYVIEGQGVVGAQPYPILEKLAQKVGAERR